MENRFFHCIAVFATDAPHGKVGRQAATQSAASACLERRDRRVSV
jgi:hypothetical protein